MHKLTLTISVPHAAYVFLRKITRRTGHKAQPPPQDLSGDRAVEWSWVAARMPPGPGRALDFGCGQSDLSLIAAQRGFSVTAIDLLPASWPYRHEGIRFVQGDILDLPLPEGHFDLILNCSSIEHVGLAGRYGVELPQQDGDLVAMLRLRSLMKPTGTMLLTIPIGRDTNFAPLHRVYGFQRLPRLLEGFRVEDSEFWAKTQDNRWSSTDEMSALDRLPSEQLYGLGCFVLRRT
jgi:SAM-dependent methyltransferase